MLGLGLPAAPSMMKVKNFSRQRNASLRLALLPEAFHQILGLVLPAGLLFA
jgi:hypothetical protein